MYKNLAFFNGLILALMIFLNGMMANIIGPYLSTLIYHVIGFIIILIIYLRKKHSRAMLKGLPLIFILPGVLNVLTILLNNVVIPYIGVTLSIGVCLFGQFVMSCFVEHFGLFQMPKNRFRKEKIVGLSLITLGIVVMIVL